MIDENVLWQQVRQTQQQLLTMSLADPRRLLGSTSKRTCPAPRHRPTRQRSRAARPSATMGSPVHGSEQKMEMA